jgi:hypothetical protein
MLEAWDRSTLNSKILELYRLKIEPGTLTVDAWMLTMKSLRVSVDQKS